ncbi:MAG: hypothetical protein ACP5LD_00360 [Desulfomonilaceae bacterium]
MKTLINTLYKLSAALLATQLILCWAAAPADSAPYRLPKIDADERPPFQYLSKSSSDQLKNLQASVPDSYLSPTLNQWLNLALPTPVKQGLDVGAGYDQWEGLPTLRAEYFLPIKAWPDKSIFVSPRVNLTRADETFSLCGGVRQLLTSEALVGFYAFHDWKRSRRIQQDFLKQAGMGVELSLLPGYHSDVSLRINAYFPVNQRRVISQTRNHFIEESLPTGADASLSLLLPAFSDALDFRITAQANSYRGASTNIHGYRCALQTSSRNGLFLASFEKGYERLTGDYFRIDGSLNLTFDWTALLAGQNPFSAPYAASSSRYDRRLSDALYERIVRRHDLPMDRQERPLALAAVVAGETVVFHGSFPELPNSRVTVQISQSPWKDYGEVVTDGKGTYHGRLVLAPGKYRIRLVHKATGVTSEDQVVFIGPQQD